MIFNSLHFLIFFPIVVCLYFVIPKKVRYIWLLVCSYYFYMSWNAKYAVLIATSTVITWAGALFIEKSAKRQIRILCLVSVLVSNLGILFFFKYFNFFLGNINRILNHMNVQVLEVSFDVLLPVGISFYTFQALGYTIDVFRKNTRAEKNLLRYALFVSFFPQLVAGPIERSKNLLKQMHEVHSFDAERVKNGLLLMLWGFFQKVVIADRIALCVTNVYDNYTAYTGLQIAIATILFAVQIYCDFAGYSDIAVGAAQVMGFRLMQNFRAPYFSKSVAEFWRRWHISLSTWLRDYIYIPLGGSRCGRLRKYVNTMVTFLVSGLWHGASWNYVVWGGLNGGYQVAGDVSASLRKKIAKHCKIRTECFTYRLFQMLLTFCMVDFAWLFFRAESLKTALHMLWHGIHNIGLFSWIDANSVLGITTLGIDEKDFYLMLITITVLFVVDVIRIKYPIRVILEKQNLVFRWGLYYMVILIILIFGVYGVLFDASSFIYFQF